jgi:ribonucleoside-diphosphate reductase beta chain
VTENTIPNPFYGYDLFQENKFLRKVAEYQKSGVMNTDGEAQKISFDADFRNKKERR